MRGSVANAVLAASGILNHAGGWSNVVSLVGDRWTLSNPSLNVSVPAHLPSQAHLDLYDNQVIGDPLFGLNNFNLRWVAWSNWTYTSDPIDGLTVNNATSTWLLFDGLDTFTSISYCGQHVADTDNQFRQYYFDVSDIARHCPPVERVVELNFGSAPLIADAIAAKSNQTWPAGVQQVFQFPNRWFIRKEQSDFGWDWGPAFAPAGPWKAAQVVQLDNQTVHVRNSIVDIYRQGQLPLLPPDQSQPWVVNASMDYIGTLPANVSMRYTLRDLHNETIVSSGALSGVNRTGNAITGSTIIPENAVELWWPSRMGPQTLYYLTINILSSENCSIAQITKRVGFRTIVLNELPISAAQLAQGIAPGNNWHFEVNGHEFYAKGSNFIPPDAFWPRVTPERISRLFDAAIAANQNMLRVWASGAYSPDFMYELADEKGLLLWSEFEFGDALYPVDPAFLDNVRQEAEYQVRRVNHHPSLALWAGGNELENLELMLVKEAAPDKYEYYKAQYETLFLDTLVPAVFENSRSISYTPSSTSNGWQSLNFSNPQPIVERYYNLTPGSVYGETDFYNYDASVLYNDSKYPVGRFSNEFGFHSMPSIQSWRQQVSSKDLHFNSTVIMHRNQHLPPGGVNITDLGPSSVGQAQMTNAVEMWFPIPNKTNSFANFSAWCHATQLYQADLYVSEIQFYRRGSGLPNRQLGSLYWQLEDLWVAPTWASIEYDGRWKVVHYAVRNVYEPVIIAPYYDSNTGNLTVWVTSDLWQSVSGTAKFTWYDWTGEVLSNITKSDYTFEVGAINSTQIFAGNTTTLFGGRSAENTILRMQIEANGTLPNNATMQIFRNEAWFHPTGLNKARLVDPGLQLSYDNSTKNFTVTATSGVAAWVWLDYPAGAVLHFDDNAFWLAPNETRQTGYSVTSDSTGGKWVEGVTVQSLWNLTLST